LREETFELAEAFADFAGVEGGEVVEGEGEERFHRVGIEVVSVEDLSQ
jgi:hypothetical protein